MISHKLRRWVLFFFQPIPDSDSPGYWAKGKFQEKVSGWFTAVGISYYKGLERVHRRLTDVFFPHVCMWAKLLQLCLTLFNPMDCSLPGSYVHGILQAGILEWDAISFSRGSSWPRDWTPVSGTAGRHFTVWVRTLLIYCRIFSLDPYSEQYSSCQEWKFRVRPRFKSSLSLN